MNEFNIGEKQIALEIKKTIDSGNYTVVGLDLFTSLDKLSLKEEVKWEYEYTLELYKMYINQINNFTPEILNLYLSALKNADVADNQDLAKEDPFLTSLYRQKYKKYAVDYLINQINNSQQLTPEVLKTTHGILMEGTSSSHLNNYDFRKNDRKFVGTIINGKRHIKYFPIRSEEIEAAADILCREQYQKEFTDHDDLIKPIIIHGIIATLQMFDDGNTRLARLLQHVAFYDKAQKTFDEHFDSPTIYATRTYFPHRGDYRNLITNLAINPDNDAWNNWIKFNLRRIQDQILANDDKVKKMKKIKL